MIRIINGDCMKYMKEMTDKAFNLAICDPPYGIERLKNPNGRLAKYGDTRKANNNVPQADYFSELQRVSRNQIIWGANYFEGLKGTRCFIVWDKKQLVDNYSQCEYAWTSFNLQPKIFTHQYSGFLKDDSDIRIHPTQKPIKLYEWLLKNYAKPGDKILDTHLGSGSIAIACYNLGFDLTAYEIDLEYYEAATKRLSEHISQMRLFGDKSKESKITQEENLWTYHLETHTNMSELKKVRY